MASKNKTQYAKDQVAPNLFITEKEEGVLVQYILERLDFSRPIRDQLVDRFSNIDQDYAGFLNTSAEDLRRQKLNKIDGKLRPTDVHLQLTAAQLDEEVTFLMSIFAPDGSMYEAMAEKEKQPIARAFTLKLNDDATRMEYYRNHAKVFLNGLKYNLGGWTIDWEVTKGTLLGNNLGSNTLKVTKNATIWEGNAVKSIDMYNFLWDVTVHPIDLPMKGEWFALVWPETQFSLQRMEMNNEIYLSDDFKEGNYGGDSRYGNNPNSSGQTGSAMVKKYYREKPTIRIDIASDGSSNIGGGSTNWVSVLSMTRQGNIGPAFERIEFVGWINIVKLGIKVPGETEDDISMWRINMINSECIVSMEKLDNAHGMLPCAFISPNEDDMGLATKSTAETLGPLNVFASFMLNVHQRASRRALYGVTIYDPTVVDLDDVDPDVAGRIKVRPTGQDKDVRRHLFQFNDAPNTTSTMDDIEKIYMFMQKVLPTDITSQVANLERATQYQAAATVQGTNRRSYKMAKMAHSQGISKVNMMIMYNVMQKMKTIEILDPESGQMVQANPAQFRDTKLEYVIGDGLKGIDRLMIIENVKEIFGMLVQTPDLNQEVDVVAMANYLTSMMGERFDLTQFRKLQPYDQLNPQQKQAAFALLQQQAQQMAQQQQAQQGGQRALPAPGA